MSNSFIQVGIDLGTTNSCVAINNKGNIEIIKNPERDDYTPSVFGFDKAKNKSVGKRAYEKLFLVGGEDEVKNYKAEVKRIMGTSETHFFERVNKQMTAEEISAEILLYLKESILKIYPEFDTSAAVITVPAYFSILESEATRRAGNLAGFNYVVLLQEPIAAAMAYGFQNVKDEKWLVYDLGGGTFDVALISSDAGMLSVKGHAGDNYLGGKDFDWLVVDKVIAPRLTEKFELKDFNRSNLSYKGIFSRLKYYAETAKKYLSQDEKTVIEIDNIGADNSGNDIYLTIDFSRSDFEKLIEPLVSKTIELSKETIKNSGINESSISKIILVGGPTQIPYIRKRLNKELGINVDASIDPLTVVGKGAAVFAITQKIPSEHQSKKINKDGKYEVNLNYEPMTSDTEEIISGSVSGIDPNKEYYVQIQSESGYYTSSKIKLKGGKFLDTLSIEKSKSNLFWIYLFDGSGNSVPLTPDSFTITHGLSVTGAPIAHSIGVAIYKKDASNNFVGREVFDKFFEKGSILPLKKTKTYYTVKPLKKGDLENALPIKVYEGESIIPDRNTFICDLEISGKDISYDLPDKVEVELTISLNESREVKVDAFIPKIDLSLVARSTEYDEKINIEQMESELLAQRDRLQNIENSCSIQEKNKIEDYINQTLECVSNAKHDEDEKRKVNKQIKDIKSQLDKLELDKQLPQLIDDFNSAVESVQKLLDTLTDKSDKTKFQNELESIRVDGQKAIEKEDRTIISRLYEQLQTLYYSVMFSNPAYTILYFERLLNNGYKFKNQDDAQYYVSKGLNAVNDNDTEEAVRCSQKLFTLIPQEEKKLAGIGL